MAVKVYKYEAARPYPAGDAFNAAKTANDAAMAVLVADAAAPTQAHVTTADAALTALNATFAAGVTIIVESTTTHNQLDAILADFRKRF